MRQRNRARAKRQRKWDAGVIGHEATTDRSLSGAPLRWQSAAHHAHCPKLRA